MPISYSIYCLLLHEIIIIDKNLAVSYSIIWSLDSFLSVQCKQGLGSHYKNMPDTPAEADFLMSTFLDHENYNSVFIS